MGWDEVPPQQFWQPLGSRREQEIPARSLSQAPLAASQGAALGKQLPEPFPRCEGLLGRGRQELLGCPAGSRACSARLQAGIWCQLGEVDAAWSPSGEQRAALLQHLQLMLIPKLFLNPGAGPVCSQDVCPAALLLSDFSTLFNSTA